MTRCRNFGMACVMLACFVGCAGNMPNGMDAPVETAPPLESASSGREPGPIDEDAPMEFTETESGLKYRILRNTDGAKPTAADSVKVNYRGWLDDETEFDSSYKRGEPISFPLSGVIPGWTEGMQYVPVGGMIELEIPSELGYGARGAGGSIPPNATLHFIVELIEIQ